MTERKIDKRKTAGDSIPSGFSKAAQSRKPKGKSKELSKPGRYTGEFSPNRMFLGIEDLIVKAANLDEEMIAPKKGKRLRKQIDYPGGRTRLLRYDKQGELKEIVYQDRKLSYLDSWVRASAELWMHYDANGQPTGKVLTGVVRLDEFGNIRFEDVVDGTTRIERSDGATTFLPGDGAAITSERGRVQRIAYANQNSTTLSYDDDGKLIGMRTPDGAIWRNTISTEWLVVDDAGRPVDEDSLRFDGQVLVDPNGTLTMRGLDGSVINILTNGSKSILNPDLSRVVMSSTGVVESVTPRLIPGVWHFTYEGTQLKSFTYNGVLWTREQGTTWDRSDRVEQWIGEVSIQPTGQIVFREQGLKPVTASATGAVLEKRLEGGVKVTNTDGSQVIVDGHGLVVKVSYADGSEREFEYEDQELVRFSYTDANKTFFDSYRLKGKAWTQYQGSKETGRTLKGRPEVLQSSAEFAYQDLENAVVVVHRPDGSRMILSDSLVVQEVKNAAGITRSFSFDNSGRLVAFSDNTGTWTSKDGTKWMDESGSVQTGQAVIADDGVFTWRDSAKEVLYFTDGFRLVRENGNSLLFDVRGRLVQLVNVPGDIYKFAYDESSLVSAVTRPDGMMMVSEDNGVWNVGAEDTWYGSVRLAENGEPIFLDFSEMSETRYGLDGSEVCTDLNPQSTECGRQCLKAIDGRLIELKAPVDFEELNDAAQKLMESLESKASDLETAKTVLEQLNEAERRAIAVSYEKLCGVRLESAIVANVSPGLVREELLSLLFRQSQMIGATDFAGTIRQLIAQADVNGTSDSVWRQLMSVLASMSAHDVATTNYFFASNEPYITASKAIEQTDRFPIALKKAAGIYLKGKELLTDADRQTLAELSVELEDLEMFRANVAKMTVRDRTAFVDRVGEEKLNSIFNDDWRIAHGQGLKKFSKAKTGRVT